MKGIMPGLTIRGHGRLRMTEEPPLKLIFSVKNPVAEKVQVSDGIVLDSNGGMHGVGLMNVKAVVDKYGGDFAISCDSEKFQAVVMI